MRGLAKYVGNWVTGAVLQRFVGAPGYVLEATGALQSLVLPVFGAAIVIDNTLGGSFRITATANTVITIGAPSQLVTGQHITIQIRNAFGGVMGATTFNALYKLGAAWVLPANGTSRAIHFQCDGTNWVEINRTAVDVAN